MDNIISLGSPGRFIFTSSRMAITLPLWINLESMREYVLSLFGDRIKHWITLNEPWCSAVLGYGNGHHAPGHISNTEPYIAAHNLLLSHARAVEVYRNLSLNNDGVIGITNNCDYRFPLTQNRRRY